MPGRKRKAGLFCQCLRKRSGYPAVPQVAPLPAHRDLYALNCRTHPPEHGAFFQPDDERTGFLHAIFHPRLHPCPMSMAPPRMANSTSAARRRKRRHHRNQPQSSTCNNPHGWVTVSVIQYRAFSHVSFCPGCHIQPENQTTGDNEQYGGACGRSSGN